MLSLLLSALVACGAADENEILITNANDLIKLSNSVNMAIFFGKATVYLENDIEFTDELSKAFEPIGKSLTRPFKGIFDGRGHKISGLTINTTSAYAGLFGSGKDCTITDVVIDKSCSLTNTDTGEDSATYLGGIVGFLYAETDPYFVDNCVNMMNVVYKNRADTFIDMGGIVGGLHTYLDKCFIRNCYNFGQVTFYKGGDIASLNMGGIVGESGVMFQTGMTYVHNCINYGDVTYDGPEIFFSYFGGIVGYDKWALPYNCTNYGKVTEN